MTHITRYGRRIGTMFIGTATIVCFICLFAIPFLANGVLKNEVGCYEVKVNGVLAGYANSIEEADNALADARLRFNRDYDHIIYMAPDFEVTEVNKAVSLRLSEEELSAAIYSNLFLSVEDTENELAYTLKTDDFSITLASRDDIIKLLDRVVHIYDTKAQYSVELLSDDSVWTDYKVQLVEARDKATDEDIVAAAMEGSVTDEGNEDANESGKIEEIAFAQDIRITEVPKNKASISSVDDAYNAIVGMDKEFVEYAVKEGDTLSTIAGVYDMDVKRLLELNTNLNKDSVIVPGQSITIEVPSNKISVRIKQTMNLEEDFMSNITYQDDNSLPAGQNKITQGVVGHRDVEAKVEMIDGVLISEELLYENVVAETSKTIIIVGTRNNTQYKRPVDGGSIVSFYGQTKDGYNNGIDIGVDEGTEVKAAAAGTVIRAGWYAEYGYCIDIEHLDGEITRYAHLSEISVEKSQVVSQGQVIGKSGSTGDCESPRLHFEIRKGQKTVNPLEYVDKN